MTQFFTPELPGAAKKPAVVVRVSADGTSGKKFFNLSSMFGVSDPSAVATRGVALDTRGRLHILGDVLTEGRQYIASFDGDGNLKSKIELDASQIVARGFAVFDSGDFLMLGYRSGYEQRLPEPRVAIMAADGGSLRDVVAPSDPVNRFSSEKWLTMEGVSFAVPATDGHVYFAPERGPVYAITPRAEISRTIPLVWPQDGADLVELKISGQRLAAIFDVRDKQPSSRWVAIHNIRTGEHLASYGPLAHLVMCYRSEESRDRFRLLGGRDGQNLLINASSP